jgi:hypothetical protein
VVVGKFTTLSRQEKTFHERIMNGFGEQDIYNISIVYSRISAEYP